jgi:glyoxylase I family protein
LAVRPFEVAELDHVVLRCRDQATMLAFYTEVLGLTEERRIEAIGLIQLRAGRSMIDLVPTPDTAAAEAGSLDHFCLDVDTDSIETVASYLETRGVPPVAPPMDTYGAHGFGSSVYVRDPEGNVVELKAGPRRA